MRIRLGWVSELVRELLFERKEAVKAGRPFARLGVETLEDRLVLSANLPAVPTLNRVNLNVTWRLGHPEIMEAARAGGISASSLGER